MKFKNKLFPVGLLIVAAWFLFNPNVTILDLLPDAVAYALILFSLRHLTAFVPYMREASDAFRKLFYISLLKIPALFVMLVMASQRITISLFSLSFAVVEIIFLLPAFTHLFEGLYYLGQRFECTAAIRCEGFPKRVEAVRTITYIFLVIRALLSTLPDFVFLLEYDPLTGKGMTITNTQYAFLLTCAFLLALAMGIVWLVAILHYLRGLSKDEGILALAPPNDTEMLNRESRRIQLSLPYFLFAFAAILSIDFVADHTSVLPDYLSAGVMLLLSLVFYFKDKERNLPLPYVSALYLASTILFEVFYTRFYARFSASDLTRVPEADAAYIPVISTSALKELLFLAVFFLLGFAIRRFYQQYDVPEIPQNAYEERLLWEYRRATGWQNGLCAGFAIATAALSLLDIILARSSTKVDMHPGFGGGAYYLPVAASLWIIVLVFNIALAITASVLCRRRVGEIFTMQGLEAPDSVND